MKKVIPFFISQAITLFGSQIVAFAIVCIFGAYKGNHVHFLSKNNRGPVFHV